MRTFDRETYQRAEWEWFTGDFGWEWSGLRRIASEQGFIFPPVGTKHDQRDADEPSQRAIIYRALVDNPSRTEDIVRRSHSWNEVVAGIFGMERRLADDADELERDIAWERKDEPNDKEAAMTLKAILNRIGDS